MRKLTAILLGLLLLAGLEQAGGQPVQSPVSGVVLTAIGARPARSDACFVDSTARIVVAGYAKAALVGSKYYPADSVVIRYRSDGALDPTFGNAGIVATPAFKYHDGAYAAAKYPAPNLDEDMILLAGYAIQKGGDTTENFALARYLGSGALDGTFGGLPPATAGTVTTSVTSGNDRLLSVAVQPDGRIVAAGGAGFVGGVAPWDLTLARYTSTGQLDPTFGVGGLLATSIRTSGSGECRGACLALQGGGILALGRVVGATWDLALVRYKDDGSPDTNFGDDPDEDGVHTGKVTTDFFGYNDSPIALAVDQSDRIVALGLVIDSLGWYFGLARYLPDGTLDGSFGTGGLVKSNFGMFPIPDPKALAIDPDSGKIVTVGGNYFEDRFVVGRFNSDGSPDLSFGIGGVVFTPIFARCEATAVVIQADRKIVVSGWANDGSRELIAVARYYDDGTLDGTFGALPPPAPGITVTPTAGLVTTEAGGTASFSVVLNSQPTADVTIPISSSNPMEGTVLVSSLIFTPDNWNTAQTVIITGVDDTIRDGEIAYTIDLGPASSTDETYNGLDPVDVSVTNKDNEKGKIN